MKAGMNLLTDKQAYPRGKRQFVARKGTKETFLFAEDMVGAYEVFEGFYRESTRHWAWEWVIEEIDDRPDELVQFLRQARQKGGQASKPKQGQAARSPAATMKAK